MNFPHAAPESAGPLTPTRQGVGLIEAIAVVERTDPRDITYHWLRFRRGPRPNAPESEAAVTAAGRISVTQLRFERTDEESYAALARTLAAPVAPE